jgi:hypothetical protein
MSNGPPMTDGWMVLMLDGWMDGCGGSFGKRRSFAWLTCVVQRALALSSESRRVTLNCSAFQFAKRHTPAGKLIEGAGVSQLSKFMCMCATAAAAVALEEKSREI